MIKKFLLLILLTIPGICLYAQDYEKDAQELLNLIIKGEGDTIYSRMNEEMREKTNVAMLNVIFRALERKYGTYQSHGSWDIRKIAGTALYSCDVEFNTHFLNFATAFDPDGKINVMRFVPKDSKVKTTIEPEVIEGVEDKAIKVITGNYTLPGTLTVPKGRRKPPVAILVHDAGPNDRDASTGPNKPFRDLANGLAKQGIAVIRYDKRTFVYKKPEDAGNFDEETINDVLSAVGVAEKNTSLDAKRIFIVGHGLGGMLAPRIAEHLGNRLAGLVMIAGNARSLQELVHEQVLYIASQTGSDDSENDYIEQLRKQIVNARMAGTYAYNPKIGLPFNTPESYWKFANSYNQVEVAKKLEIPMLILQGERDYQITMKDFDLWQQNLSGKKDVFFKSYPKLNHMLQEGTGTSTPKEYEKESTVPEYLIQDIAQFIRTSAL